MKLFKQQQWHLLSLTALLFGLYYVVQKDTDMLQGQLWGLSTYSWLLIAIAIPILHQIYVLVCWRLELHYKSLTKVFGAKAFPIYKAGFSLLFGSRLISIILLAISNAHTTEIGNIFSYILSVFLFIPAIYLFYSVKKYFGMDRAYGLDHFDPEKVKNMPFVKKGIFRFTSNGMYTFGFFLLWIPGVLFQSEAALFAALFNHLYIWVHFYFTELVDIREIYGE
jgi:hypothetical protein